MADLEAPQSQEYQLKSQHKCQIMSSYMLESFEADAMSIAVVAVDKHRHLKDIAYHITHTYNKKYAAGSGKAMDGVYHCCVGKSFASAVSHETRQMIHLKVDTFHIVLWKSKDTPFHQEI